MERAIRDQATGRVLRSEIVDKIEVERWLDAPNFMLEDIPPISFIERGETEQVVELLERVRFPRLAGASHHCGS